MYSGITSGRVLDGELLYTKILEVNLFAVAYRLFHGDFSPINGTSIGESRRLERNLQIDILMEETRLTLNHKFITYVIKMSTYQRHATSS